MGLCPLILLSYGYVSKMSLSCHTTRAGVQPMSTNVLCGREAAKVWSGQPLSSYI